jgi:hypothetical protein
VSILVTIVACAVLRYQKERERGITSFCACVECAGVLVKIERASRNPSLADRPGADKDKARQEKTN